MVCTNQPCLNIEVEFARNACHVNDYYHNDLGFNYRLTNLQASLGLAQLSRLKELLKKKEHIRQLYNISLDSRFERNGFEDIYSERSVCWLYTVLVSDKALFRKRMSDYNIETRPVFHPLNQLNYMPQKGNFPNSELIHKHGVSLPSYTELSDNDINYICEVANDSRFLSRL